MLSRWLDAMLVGFLVAACVVAVLLWIGITLPITLLLSGALVLPACCSAAKKFLFGSNLASLQYNDTKDAYGPFTSLAGFAVAQSVALTAVAKGDRNQPIVLTIYMVTVAVTAFWIIGLLRTTIQAPSGATIRAYDKPSLLYGRWTLGWVVLVGCLMIFLAVQRLLPNQTTRSVFTNYPIDCETSSMSNRGGAWTAIGGTSLERSIMDVWQHWLAAAKLDEPEKQRLIWIEQKGRFADNYLQTTAKLACDPHIAIKGRVAFLVRAQLGTPCPNYRQIPFRDDGSSPTEVFSLLDPNDQEFLVIIALVEARDKQGQDLINAGGPYGIKVEEAK